ncbi:MAG: hypothetical protein FJZ01_10820 [Candidatus Sericytochromatia bacterium]|nr:hypothetical protein [Candidatus Tanganyikabacteria bacterium]
MGGDLVSLTHSQYVVPAAEAAARDPATLGGKAANLARLGSLGFPVPAWFAVPTEVYLGTLALGKLDAIIRDTVADIAWDNPAAARRAAEGLADLVRRVRWDAAAAHAIAEAYQQLGKGRDILVAVRSSAVGEDSAAASFAGQHDTFLFVKGADSVVAAISACWASAFSERALTYRRRNGLDLGDIRIAVVVQEMVFGEVSGVLFTANAISNDEDQAVLSATYGLGEGLVSGELDADNWIVDRASRKVVRTEIATKAHCIVFDQERGHGTTRAEVREDARDRPCLEDAQIAHLVDLGEQIAGRLGTPQDIEWTLREGEIYLLQTRPITTLKPRPRGAKRLWDNSNIAESYYGVTTPLTFSFVNRMYEVAYQVLFDAFGIPQRVLRDHNEVFANLLGLLNGRIFYNLGNYYKIITFLPAYEYMKDFFDTMIGVQERKDYEKRRRNWLKTLFVGIPKICYLVGRIYGNFLLWDREVATFTARFNRTFEHYRNLDYASMSPDEILATYRTLEKALLWEWRAPMTNDFFAMVFFGLTRKLIAKWGIDTTGSLHNDLLCGEGGLESTEPAKELIRLGQLVRQDPELAALFAQTPEAALNARLAEPANEARFAAFRERLASYLRRYGFRCMGELKLEVKNLIEDPTFVFAMLKNYQRAENLDLAEMEKREREIRARAEQEVARALAGRALRKVFFDWILCNARKGVRHRENLRMARTKAFGLVRQLFAGLGEQLARQDVLEHPDDVFFLELADCFAWVEGRSTLTNLKALVALRKAEFATYPDMPINDRLETLGAVYYGDQFYVPPADADATGPVLQGTSCCPGRAAAPAKVILTPGDDMRLAGEILVTERTDPGWVPLYPSASGLLIERGSLLSHAAVVARELGLPTIIGIKGLVRRVQDGQWVEMDGRAGTVTLDARP